MPRTNLRSHIAGGSFAFAFLLIGSGAAWAQAGESATASGESTDTGSTSASSATGSFDATLSTNPLGLTPQSTGPQRSNNRRQADSAEDAAVEGFLRGDSGLRSMPSSSGNASTSAANDFSARPAVSSRSLGATTNSSDSVASTVAAGNGNGKAFGVNAIPSDSIAQGSSSGSDNGRALGVNASASFFSTHVRSKGNTEAEDQAKVKAHGRNADSGDLLADAGDKGKGKAHGRNADSSDVSVDEGGHGKGKKLGHARFDETVIAQVASRNPVISDAVVLPGNAAAVVPAALPSVSAIPAVAAAVVNDFSAPGLQAAPSPVPEPANWLLLALGLAVLGARALMRRGTLVR